VVALHARGRAVSGHLLRLPHHVRRAARQLSRAASERRGRCTMARSRRAGEEAPRYDSWDGGPNARSSTGC
jgi:hypothetical protein